MIAEELKVSYSEVGKSANELKIKIKNCELGCF
jgi:LAO/AO transport system kinase